MVRPHLPIASAVVRKWAVEAGLDDGALDDGLSYAGDHGWIDNGPRAGTVVVTQAGVDRANA